MPLNLLTLDGTGQGNDATLIISTAAPTVFPGEIYIQVLTGTKSRPTTGQIRLSKEQQRQLTQALLELNSEVSIPYGEMPGSPGYPLTPDPATDPDPGNWKGSPIG